MPSMPEALGSNPKYQRLEKGREKGREDGRIRKVWGSNSGLTEGG